MSVAFFLLSEVKKEFLDKSFIVFSPLQEFAWGRKIQGRNQLYKRGLNPCLSLLVLC